MRLIIASNNAHKVKEIKEILGGYFTDIQTLGEAGLDYAGGAGHDDQANNHKLLSDMEQVPEEARGCQFVSAVALVRRDREPLVVRGEVKGQLLRTPRGQGGFGYDPLFYYPPGSWGRRKKTR